MSSLWSLGMAAAPAGESIALYTKKAWLSAGMEKRRTSGCDGRRSAGPARRGSASVSAMSAVAAAMVSTPKAAPTRRNAGSQVTRAIAGPTRPTAIGRPAPRSTRAAVMPHPIAMWKYGARIGAPCTRSPSAASTCGDAVSPRGSSPSSPPCEIAQPSLTTPSVLRGQSHQPIRGPCSSYTPHMRKKAAAPRKAHAHEPAGARRSGAVTPTYTHGT